MDFKRFFTDLFTEINSNHSWMVLLYLLGAFLIGLFFTWLYWRGKYKRIKRELETRTGELSALRGKYEEQTRDLELKEADLKKAKLEIEELSARIRQLETEKGQLHADIHAARMDMEKLNTEKLSLLNQEKSYLSQLEDLDTLVLGLKTKNQTLATQADQDSNALNELAQLQSKFNAVNNKLNTLEKQNAELNEKLNSDSLAMSKSPDLGNAVLEKRIEALEAENAELSGKLDDSSTGEVYGDFDDMQVQLNNVNSENTDLKRQLEEMALKLESSGGANPSLLAKTMPIQENPLAGNSPTGAADQVRSALGNKIPLATEDQKDDLKLINGVGPFIEQKLNGLGIYTFEQVSMFDDEFSNQVTDAIEFFPGRIQRDDWAGQAKALMDGKGKPKAMKASSAAKSVSPGLGPKKVKLDDLKVVEGIGPKIEGLIKADGINTWAELADVSVERLRGILEAAGSRYRMHNPTTWPQQSALAAAGEWDELKKLQDELNGGRA